MINKKIAYLSIILLVLLLVYMSVHLFILSTNLVVVQESDGLRSAKIGFMGYEIIKENGNHITSTKSPAVIMMLISLVYVVLLIKFRGNKLLIFNLSLIVLSILLYQVFLSGLDGNLELTTTNDNFSFWNVNLIGYEFKSVETRDEIGRVVDYSSEKGVNLSLIPLVLSILGNIMSLFKRNTI
ncbi:MAG: hypothetical protein K8R25_11520 [Methanosarcinales archaeon]|nr:hypothetical protein [Methanosarcinales archaeon]